MTDETIRLREYFERLLDEKERQWELQLEARDRAVTLQTKELARRLEDLNHAHQKSIEDRQAFVTREIYEQGQKDVMSRLELAGQALAEAKGAAAVRAAVYTLGSSLVTGGLVLIIDRLWR